MITNDCFKQLALLTPSRITTAQRHGFASASINSLRSCLKGSIISHFIVHDSPVWKKLLPKPLFSLSSQLRWDQCAEEIYAAPEVTWAQGENKGSAAAMLLAVELALAEGKSFGFIHLDDHVYCDNFGELLCHGLKAMECQPNLLWTRFSGYPVIYDNRIPTMLNNNDKIVFDGVELSPSRNSDYTLWSSPLTAEANNGGYWPIAMWFCIFRLSFLKTLLEWAVANNARHLAHVESYYKNGGGFQRVLNTFTDCSFGYINMQYGGIEMHRNRNWKELLCMPNDGTR